jgi:transposase
VKFRLAKHDDRRSLWLKALAARRGFNRALVALANKTARIAGLCLLERRNTRRRDHTVTAPIGVAN